MEVHSTTVDQPPEESHSPVHSLVGGFIALLTLALPIYITAHYSTNLVPTMSIPASSPAPVRR